MQKTNNEEIKSCARSGLPVRDAFTLIELLVVIAVIGILAAILIPAVGSVRERANQSKCASHLRQLQVASLLYASEKNTYVPVTINYDKGDSKVPWYQNEKYLECLGDEEMSVNLLRCPTHEAVRSANPSGQSSFSYGINLTNIEAGWSAENVVRADRVLKVENPAETLAFADAVDWQIGDYGADRYEEEKYVQHAIAYRHNGRANVVHFDGSVASLTREEVVGNRKLWRIKY